VDKILIRDIDVREEGVLVNLLTIYDKTDTATISDKELKDLIRAFYGEF
jgi:hypothetical protein